jgi:hypothetical protein
VGQLLTFLSNFLCCFVGLQLVVGQVPETPMRVFIITCQFLENWRAWTRTMPTREISATINTKSSQSSFRFVLSQSLSNCSISTEKLDFLA